MSLKAQFDLSEAQSELCSCSQSFWKAPGRSCWDMSLLKREGLGDHRAHLLPVGSNSWPDPVQGVGTGMDSSPWGMVVRRWMSTALHRSGAGVSLPGACCAVTARCGQSMGVLLCLFFPPHFPGAEGFHHGSTMVALSLQSESPDFPVPQSKIHVTVSGTSDLEGEEGWDWVSPGLGELLEAPGLGCSPLASLVSALQTGSSLLSPQPEQHQSQGKCTVLLYYSYQICR